MGLSNITTTCRDGLNYPKSAGKFDCVLVDAPCSCEGISRKRPKVLRRPIKHPERMINRQKRLLAQAIDFCRNGGRVLYSTCTYAPEENELVVNDLLSIYEGRVTVLPVSVRGLKKSDGLTNWEGNNLQPALKHTVRIWPHQNDTGGFYMALLKKEGPEKGSNSAPLSIDDADDPSEPEPDDCQATEIPRHKILGLLNDRFGMEASDLDSFRFFTNRKGIVHAIIHDHFSPPVQDRVTGLPLLHTAMRYPKLTTNGAMAFGHLAKRHVIDLTTEQRRAYIARNPFSVSKSQASLCHSDGYVILRYEGISLGVGFCRLSDLRVASLYPKRLALD
jgi:NOL1/NOP2/fmu family ribosome biogenesis protein